MSVRILNAEPHGYSGDARRILQGLGEVVEDAVAQSDLAERVRGFDVLIVRLGLRVTREVLAAGDRLRFVVSATTGLDHIDVDAAAARGVTVLSLRGEREFLRSIPATAEHAWALLLALVRRIPWAFASVRLGEWDRDRFRGRDLAGRRLGVLGLGRVGERVARYGLAFGMAVGAWDPYRERWVDGVQQFPSLEEFLRWTGILSVHLPLTRETDGFLDRARLGMLPRGALVVNTARGAIINEAALVALLEHGHLAGAAVDVLAVEQPAGERGGSPILRYAVEHDNLLVTPHTGGATSDSMARTEMFMAEKLHRHLAGRSAGPPPATGGITAEAPSWPRCAC